MKSAGLGEHPNEPPSPLITFPSKRIGLVNGPADATTSASSPVRIRKSQGGIISADSPLKNSPMRIIRQATLPTSQPASLMDRLREAAPASNALFENPIMESPAEDLPTAPPVVLRIVGTSRPADPQTEWTRTVEANTRTNARYTTCRPTLVDFSLAEDSANSSELVRSDRSTRVSFSNAAVSSGALPEPKDQSQKSCLRTSLRNLTLADATDGVLRPIPVLRLSRDTRPHTPTKPLVFSRTAFATGSASSGGPSDLLRAVSLGRAQRTPSLVTEALPAKRQHPPNPK